MSNTPADFFQIPEGLGFTDTVQPCYVNMTGEHAIFGIRVEEQHCNPAGICHGGALMTFLDIAFGGVVMNKLTEFYVLPTITMNTDFVSPGIKGDWLESEINFFHLTKTMAFVGGIIKGSNGPVVRANASFRLPKNAIFKDAGS
ncbi:MAG: PaaI family thioesterase [Pseudomonadales bacterium]|nr:PaaI family thioesterase [Pseudomonadales bacterium]